MTDYALTQRNILETFQDGALFRTSHHLYALPEYFAAVVFLILLGNLTVVYGVKLLSCDDALFGHLKMLAYLNIAGGILAGSVVLAVIAPIATAAAAVVAALVFFKSSKLIRDQGSLVS